MRKEKKAEPVKNSEYWKERFQQMENARHESSAEKIIEIQEQIDKAQHAIEEKINAWYQRFANNNNLPLVDAQKQLNSKELKEFKWDVNDYIKYGKKNAVDQRWMKELENASARVHISRLEQIKLQTQQYAEAAFGSYNDILDNHIKDLYKQDYYHTAYEIQKGIGVGYSFAGVDEDKLEKVINKPWASDGANFSDRIWTNKQKLVNQLHTSLTQMCITGEGPDRAIKEIAKAMGSSKYQAGRLVMTESAYFGSQAQKECFNELDVEKYEIVATLDSHTSDICQEMDGKVFKMSEYEAGVTAPPFHVNCRSCTCPHFDDEFAGGERAARDEDGKTYHVPADMTYKEWKETIVDGKTVVKANGFDIIKNITIDDFKDAALGKDIQPEILSVINDNCKDKGMFFNDVAIEKIPSEDGKKVLLQTEPYFGGQRVLTRLKINEDIFKGRSLSEINKQIEESPNILADNLQEAVWHENGHAKTYFNKTIDEVERINKELDNIHYDELSPTASQDGSELIAEVEVLLRRGAEVPSEALEVYNKYIGG